MTSTENKFEPSSDAGSSLAAKAEGDEHIQEQAGSMAGGDSTSQDGSLAPSKKRARRSTTDAAPHKRVRGKRGGLKGLMKLPIEIFTEITYLLTPGDLLALSWSSKFFRNMLLQRSAAKIWRYAESNVPDLPPCPVGMYEPQYAALLFAKYCTLCGASATAKPDPYLFVRLCASCRKSELKEMPPLWRYPQPVDRTLVDESGCINIKPENARLRGTTVYFSLKCLVDKVLRTQEEFRSAGDKVGLALWEQDRRQLVLARQKHGGVLHKYLESVHKSRGEELDNLKQQRKAAITERLKALGWTDRDIELTFIDRKLWWGLVEVPKPLTKRIWNNILPKLTPLLEENREKQAAFDKKANRVSRRYCVDRYLEGMQRLEHPLEPIAETLRAELPPRSDSDEFDFSNLGGPGELHEYRLKNLLPNTKFALQWDCLADLSEREIATEDVEAELKARREQIEQRVLEWRVGVERQLVDKFESGVEVSNEDVVLTVKGSTELAENLSRDLRILLRADTVFKLDLSQSDTYESWHRPKRENSPYYYPNLVTMLYQDFYESIDSTADPLVGRDIDLTGFQRNTEAEKIVKLLLKDLGMSDVTRIELQVMQSRFVCGRCIDKAPKTWDEIVTHYIRAPELWEQNKDVRDVYLTRHPVVYRDVHQLESTIDYKPLIRFPIKEVAHSLRIPNCINSPTRPSCFLCLGTGRGYHCSVPGDVMVHLQDVLVHRPHLVRSILTMFQVMTLRAPLKACTMGCIGIRLCVSYLIVNPFFETAPKFKRSMSQPTSVSFANYVLYRVLFEFHLPVTSRAEASCPPSSVLILNSPTPGSQPLSNSSSRMSSAASRTVQIVPGSARSFGVTDTIELPWSQPGAEAPSGRSKVSLSPAEADESGNSDTPGVEEDDIGGIVFVLCKAERTKCCIPDRKGEDDEYDSSNQGDVPTPSKKRARSEQTIAKSTRKKYVRGKQGGLKGLMKMPVDIFTEIAYLLNPGDLVALSRSSKFFRNMLLQRSAVQMWRRAESNMDGLPPCPPDMCEPQYAALVFSKCCTLCGASATAKPDPDLGVRVCPSCRDTKLLGLNPRYDAVVSLVFHSDYIRPKKTKSQSRASRNLVFSLKHEVEEVYRKQMDFRNAGDEQGLAQWEKDRRAAVLARSQHANQLRLYFNQVGFLREDELAGVKEQRKANIIERLEALGWTGQDTEFRGPEATPWRALVEVPKPLTDRIWNNLLPKLTPLLEANRERNTAHGKKERRIERRARVDKFLLEMRYTAHPFQSILEALGVPPPPLPDLNGPRSMRLILLSKNPPKIVNPFPKTDTALQWDCLNDLSETEMTIQEVEAKLEERKAEIEAKVLEWRTTVEQRLVENLELGANAPLVVEGSTDSTVHLSHHARVLLRADTIFKRVDSGPNIRPPILYNYPEFISPFNDCVFTEYVHFLDSGPRPETNLDHYERFTEAERMTKALLRALDMADVTLAELELRKRGFMCERCTRRIPLSWRRLVEHYIMQYMVWEEQKDSRGGYPTRHPVMYRNVHDVESADNHKPLVRLCDEEEAEQLSALVGSSLLAVFGSPHCHLCEGTGRPDVRLSQADMLAHMQDVHDVTEPVEDLHYGMQLYKIQGNTWHKKWDAYHDARESKTMALPTAAPPG
ncbi:hypothetical protein FRC10_010856 [Ceratobasidium sp. 414]|nr:hypothetical protein FRC10_010856 [Ceratobasidium sp. 414]